MKKYQDGRLKTNLLIITLNVKDKKTHQLKGNY